MARTFNGTTDYVAIAGGTYTCSTDAFSIGMWFATTTAVSSVLLGESSTASNTPYGFFQIASAANNFRFVLQGDTNQGIAQDTSGNYDDGIFHHACATYDGTTLRLFLDGVASGTHAVGAVGTRSLNTRQLGRLLRTTDTLYCAATIAEAFTYGVVLSLDEINMVMRGHFPRVSSRVEYWPVFGVQSPEPDWSGANNHGTVSGTSTADHPRGISAVWLKRTPSRIQKVVAAVGGMMVVHPVMSGGMRDLTGNFQG